MTFPHCILFDCINTLIGVRDHETYWTELGRDGTASGLFSDADTFRSEYLVDLTTRRRDPTYQETSLADRLLSLDCVTTEFTDEEKTVAADDISERFATRYLERTYVLPGVSAMLDSWRDRAKIGVVSDFFTAGLPRRLLDRHGLLEKADAVIDSCEVGWRKPNPRIYLAAFKELDVDPNQASNMLFIGDNPVCDVAGPRDLGMKALWYGHGNTECDIWDWRTFKPATYITNHEESAP